MNRRHLPTDCEGACVILGAEISLHRFEAQEMLGASMLEGLISKGYARQDRTDRVGLTPLGAKVARSQRELAISGAAYDDE